MISRNSASLRQPTRPEADSESPWNEPKLSHKESLQDYLLWQLHLSLDDEESVFIGEELIGNIDDDGYLRARTDEIASLMSLEKERVEKVLEVIQNFDPPGVGARGIEECQAIHGLPASWLRRWTKPAVRWR